jgi:succinyl-diaminopimelate desuccinylase
MQVSRLCQELIRIHSENPPGDTREVIQYIQSYLDGLGVSSELLEGEGERVNLLSLPHPGHLLLCGHVDTVPALEKGWSHDPFSGDIDEGIVWGRGASDMKGGCASLLSAVARLVEEGEEPPVNLAFVCDEETGGAWGIRHLLSAGRIPPCDCLIAEPTPAVHPLIGQKGLCRINFRFDGIPAHASVYPRVGRSAIMEAVTLIEFLQELHTREFPVKNDLKELIGKSSLVLEKEFGIPGIREILTRVTFNPGVIRGGEKANVVAQSCWLELDLRVPWGYAVQHLLEEVKQHAPHAHLQVVDCSDPNYTPLESPIVGLLCTEIQKVLGVPATPIVQWAASDAKYLRKVGCRVVEYGPGDVTTLHGIDERVSESSLESATAIYMGLIQRYAQDNPLNSSSRGS